MDTIKKPLSVLGEFKKFISRGSVIDLAVGIIIGSSFTAIVNSLVKDIILPPIGFVIGKVNFSDLKIVLQRQPDVAIAYGAFLQALLNFFIVSFVVFLLVKVINRFQKKEEPSKSKETELSVLKDIRKALKSTIK